MSIVCGFVSLRRRKYSNKTTFVDTTKEQTHGYKLNCRPTEAQTYR